MRKKIVLMNHHKELVSFPYINGLTDHQNMVLAAASFMLGKGLYSMSTYCHDSYRIYPYQITYTKKGNISYAGQVLDETNPVIYTVWVEPCGG